MNSSANIATLAAALVEAQKEFSPAVKAKDNPAFKGSKYVDLASAIDAAQPALLKNGIAVLQGASGDIAQQSVTITTRVLHSSGEWIEDALTLPAVNRSDFTAQSAGSAITYARRYSYMAILGFAPEDDDGNAASNGHQETKRAVKTPTAPEDGDPGPDYDNDYDAHMGPRPAVSAPLDPKKAKVLYAIAMGKKWTTQDYRTWVNRMGFSKDSDIPAARFNELKEKLEAA